ncbi:MAG: hypothetical protein C3F06_02210 [Candidatus Methanoperedenaceae archaeon]|nr:MAG: hypothetical protein C3F06_02210 [Candidatus Methanoperedenaceae archaeon]
MGNITISHIYGNFLYRFLIISILILLFSIPSSYAITNMHENISGKISDSKCSGCHLTSQPDYSQQDYSQRDYSQQDFISKINIPFFNSMAVSDYTAILTIGQTPYQLGPFFRGGGNGWSWWDTDNYGNEKQKNLISLMILNKSTAKTVTGLTLSVNVSYPHLTLINITDPLTPATILQYSTNMQQVNLQEDINHPGTYIGFFKYDPFTEQYSGNYSVTLYTIINGSRVIANGQFQTTVLGCQSCHNKKLTGVETSFAHADGGGMKSCMFVCHGGSRGFYGGSPPFMGPQLTANPMHVHEMQYGHNGGFLAGMYYPQPAYNIKSHATATTCVQCHTSFLHDNTGTNTTSIGSYTLYGTNIDFSTGTHQKLTCEYCHGSLAYPEIPQDQYQLQGSLGNYSPSFTSYESFTDTYIINVNGPGNLTITVNGDNTTQIIELYAIGPVDNTTTALQGPCGGNPCDIARTSPINMTIPNPYFGTWIVKLTGWQEARINYTISSNYPIERKPIIKIPDCNSCHNANGIGNASTTDQIPDWNPGFAHADTNNDGSLDVQCRMCHDAMHNIVVKDCNNCHTIAPANHPIQEPVFAKYTPAQCLNCHGDPHNVTFAGGTDCIACHSQDVNISLFGRHADINTSDGVGNVTNNDCWTCHYQKDMSRSGVYLCESCHINSTGIVNVTNTSLIKSDLMHGMTTCKTCHAPSTPGFPASPAYHLNGSVGPLGVVEKIFAGKSW